MENLAWKPPKKVGVKYLPPWASHFLPVCCSFIKTSTTVDRFLNLSFFELNLRKIESFLCMAEQVSKKRGNKDSEEGKEVRKEEPGNVLK
jgi:hypothetical protein